MIHNIKTAKELVKLYRSITLERINETFKYIEKQVLARGFSKTYFSGSGVANRLTGFGNAHTCSLCITVNHISNYSSNSRKYCIYYIVTGFKCTSECNNKTYLGIYDSLDSEELLVAFKARADYIEQLINKYENGNKHNSL